MSTTKSNMSTSATPAVHKPRAKKSKTPAQPARLKVSAEQGIHISVPRVKHYIDDEGINDPIETAIRELRNAEPHQKAILDDKGKVIPDKFIVTDLITYDKISESTKKLVAEAEALDQKRDQTFTAREEKKSKRTAEEIAAGRLKQEELDKKAADEAEKVRKHQEELAARNAERIANKQAPRGGPKKQTPYGDKIEFLSLMKTRYAKDAAPYIAAVADSAVQELAEFGLANTLRDGRKILKSRHLIKSGYEQLRFTCFFRNLPSWRDAQAAEVKRLADADANKEATKLSKKELKKAQIEAAIAATTAAAAAGAAAIAAVVAPAPAAAAPAAPAAPAAKKDTVEDDNGEDDGLSFKLYVRHVCYNVINNAIASWTDKKLRNPYEDVMISKEANQLLNNLVLDFIAQLCPLLASQLRVSGIKTVTQPIIEQVINMYLETNNIKHEGPAQEFKAKIDKFTTWSEAESIAAKAKKAEKEAAKANAEAIAAANAPVAAAVHLPLLQQLNLHQPSSLLQQQLNPVHLPQLLNQTLQLYPLLLPL